MNELLPREKALNYGINSLNNDELLALILKSAYHNSNVLTLSNDLINKAGGFNNLLSLTYDELVEITPENIRLRKKILDPTERLRAGRK